MDLNSPYEIPLSESFSTKYIRLLSQGTNKKTQIVKNVITTTTKVRASIEDDMRLIILLFLYNKIWICGMIFWEHRQGFIEYGLIFFFSMYIVLHYFQNTNKLKYTSQKYCKIILCKRQKTWISYHSKVNFRHICSLFCFYYLKLISFPFQTV